MSINFTDFYIKYEGHPNFNDKELIEDEVIKVVIQKYEMILFTNKGELFCDSNFGGDLSILLHETKLSANSIEAELKSQISTYITELNDIDYSLKVEFYEDGERYQEIMVIGFKIKDYEVYARVF